MKLVSGKLKGRNIYTLKSNKTRPTISRVREDIFNILNNYFIFQKKICIDLFSGSGALGIEAISNGIKHCYFNDKNKDAYNIILKNLSSLKIKNYNLYNNDYETFLKYLFKNNIKIDLLFLDPPFKEHTYYYNVFKFIIKFNLLNLNSIIIIESEFEINFDNYMKKNEFFILKQKKYGYKYLYVVRKCE